MGWSWGETVLPSRGTGISVPSRLTPCLVPRPRHSLEMPPIGRQVLTFGNMATRSPFQDGALSSARIGQNENSRPITLVIITSWLSICCVLDPGLWGLHSWSVSSTLPINNIWFPMLQMGKTEAQRSEGSWTSLIRHADRGGWRGIQDVPCRASYIWPSFSLWAAHLPLFVFTSLHRKRRCVYPETQGLPAPRDGKTPGETSCRVSLQDYRVLSSKRNPLGCHFKGEAWWTKSGLRSGRPRFGCSSTMT